MECESVTSRRPRSTAGRSPAAPDPEPEVVVRRRCTQTGAAVQVQLEVSAQSPGQAGTGRRRGDSPIPRHRVDLGEQTGSETVTLLPSEIPSHAHTVSGSTRPASTNNAEGQYWARVANFYTPAATGPPVAMAPRRETRH